MEGIITCAFVVGDKTMLAAVRCQQQASCCAGITAAQRDLIWVAAALHTSSHVDTTINSPEVQKKVFV